MHRSSLTLNLSLHMLMRLDDHIEIVTVIIIYECHSNNFSPYFEFIKNSLVKFVPLEVLKIPKFLLLNFEHDQFFV